MLEGPELSKGVTWDNCKGQFIGRVPEAAYQGSVGEKYEARVNIVTETRRGVMTQVNTPLTTSNCGEAHTSMEVESG